MEDYFKRGNPEGKSRREIFGEPMRSIPAFHDPAARLEVMNDLGIERTLMFPTLASLLEERMRDDPDLIMAVVHGLNQWMEEVWAFDYKSRIFTTPVISLPIVDQAIAELNWAHERGARAILVRPAPVPGWKGPRSFALPEFDPFWKRCSDLGVLVAMHSSDSGYARYQQEWEGKGSEMLPFVSSAWRAIGQWRPVTDAVASWVCHGALFRHPELKVAVIENGSAWLTRCSTSSPRRTRRCPKASSATGRGGQEPDPHQPVLEEDLEELSSIVGVERVLFGSDWPHPEGLADPSATSTSWASCPARSGQDHGGNLARLVAA